MTNEVSKATHTPGGWKQVDADLMGIYIGVDGHDGSFLALVHDSDFITVEEAQANARLISAAPDLVAVLDDYHTALHAMAASDCTVEQCRGRAVLQKARGT